MLAALTARAFSRTRPAYGDGNFGVAQNARGDLWVAQGLPLKAELVRQGDTWTCAIATGSAFTYVNAWPTTRAELVLYNGDPNKLYVVDSAFMTDVSSAAAAHSKALLAQLAPAGTAAAPTNDTAQLITSRCGKGYAGNAKRAVANTAFAVANKWEAVAAAVTANTATIGTTVFAELFGGWVVPPGAALCLAGLASTAAGTAVIGVTWHEVPLQLAG